MGRSPEVDEFIRRLNHALAPGVEMLRGLILSADPRVRESIKWNAPSFFIEDHFATFNLHSPDRLQIVLHTGAKAKADALQIEIDDPHDLLIWRAVDRATVIFGDAADCEAKADAFLAILKQWIRRTAPDIGLDAGQ
jgi:hypothetical protein